MILAAAAALTTSLPSWADNVTTEKPSGSIVKPLNDKGFGTFSGRIQFLGMYRDFENVPTGQYGHSSTLGALLNYVSPTFAGFDVGAAYNYAGTLYDGGNTDLLCNDDIYILNEVWLRYNLEAMNLKESQILVGRKITNGEVFRTDDFRHKARSIETLQFTSKDISNTELTVGHATALSNWIDAGEHWKFNDFGDVFCAEYDTDGVTWAEGVYTGVDNWKISLFDAYAWDVANLFGTRIQFDLCDEASWVGYYRHEGNVGLAETRNSDAWGLSYQQKVGGFTLEPGYFAVHGSGLRFQEATTGINHPLGCSMIIYGGQFNGGAKTAYLKATTKVSKTVFYALYNYTWQDQVNFDGQELNLVVKHPITDRLTACFKGAVGYRDWKAGAENTTATDGRLFVTYTF